jgi:hypothetical protein
LWIFLEKRVVVFVYRKRFTFFLPKILATHSPSTLPSHSHPSKTNGFNPSSFPFLTRHENLYTIFQSLISVSSGFVCRKEIALFFSPKSPHPIAPQPFADIYPSLFLPKIEENNSQSSSNLKYYENLYALFQPLTPPRSGSAYRKV